MLIKCRKIVVFMLLTGLLLVPAVACRRETTDNAPYNASGKTIRFGYITADQLHSPAVMVMKEKKLLEAAGFNVEWHEYIAGSYTIQDMAAGKLDFANCGVAPIIINHSQGMNLAILSGSNQEGSSLVVTDLIKTITDLDGKTIATPGLGSIQDTIIVRLEMMNNITIKHTTMEVTDMPDFLRSGEIDGFIAWAPHPANAVSHNAGHELLTSHDVLVNHQCCVMVTEADTLKNDPETVNKVLEIYLEAYRWFLENQDEAIELLVMTTGISEDVIRRAITTVKYAWPPYCNADSIADIAQGLINAGRITTKEAELDDFVKSLYQPGLMETITGTKRPD